MFNFIEIKIYKITVYTDIEIVLTIINSRNQLFVAI